MICVVIKGPSIDEVYTQINEALSLADLIELRLDHFESIDTETLKNIRHRFSIPMIFTLRNQSNGGHYLKSEATRLNEIQRLIELQPEYFDIEHDVSDSFLHSLFAQNLRVKFILSYHNFSTIPQHLPLLLQDMQNKHPTYYKIAITPQSCLEALQFLCHFKEQPNVILIGMGMHGQMTRILGPILGSPITYTTLNETLSTAPGQLLASDLIQRYRFHSLNPSTRLYGLIGDPVDQSISDLSHNALFSRLGHNAIYVKMQIKPAEIQSFLSCAKQLGFQGLSVTMPLKEQIVPYLDSIDPSAQEIGAVNTLLLTENHIHGYNTDGIGALNALEKCCSVNGKHLVLIGAGGAARAIAYEAIRRGARVTIVNRNPTKALQLAKELKCTGMGLDQMTTLSKKGYDILINCTPLPLPIPQNEILPNGMAMDIVTKPKESAFLKAAKAQGCHIIYGYNMFIEQALGQFQLWFKDSFDLPKNRILLEQFVLSLFSN